MAGRKQHTSQLGYIDIGKDKLNTDMTHLVIWRPQMQCTNNKHQQQHISILQISFRSISGNFEFSLP